MLDGGERVEHSRGDEDEGEAVGPDHPLAVNGDVTVTRGDEGGDSEEEPEAGLGPCFGVEVGEGGAYGFKVMADDERGGSGDEDADDVDLAKKAVEGRVSLAETGGELQGAEEESRESGESVGKEDEFFAEDAGAVRAAGREERVLGEDEDGEEGEAHEEPEGGLGEVRAARGRG